MAKTKQFDEEKVLQQIAEHFWQHGYAATKVDQLSELTGLTKTSIYNAYGNKEALFIRVLDFYVKTSLEQKKGILDLNEPMSVNLDRLLTNTFLHPKPSKESKLSYGCLLTNTIVELAANEPVLHEKATLGYRQIRNTMRDFFAHYVETGKVSEDLSAEGLTDVFMTFFQGLRVQSRNTAAGHSLEISIQTFLQFIRSLERGLTD